MSDIAARGAAMGGAAAGGEKATRFRVLITVLLFVSVVINYLDRSNLSITAPAMQAELGFDTAQMGLILSAFGWTYALCQIPGGWLVDRVAPRVLYAALILLYREPRDFPGTNAAEVELIRRGGGLVDLDRQHHGEQTPASGAGPAVGSR